MRTVLVAPHAVSLPAHTLRRLHNAPARAALWALAVTLFLVTTLI